MIVKLLIGLVIVIALVRMIGRRRPASGRVSRSADQPAGGTFEGDPGRDCAATARVPRADDLEKCAGCGIWLPRGQDCGCDARA